MRYHIGLFILISVVGLISVGPAANAGAAVEGPVMAPQVRVSETPTYPYDAEVTGDDVYIRSGPGSAYYPCGKLNTGDKVKILADMDGVWSKIQPPAGSFSWISAQYVTIDPTDQTMGTVTGDDVRVWAGSDRVRPEASTRLQGKLNKGEKVTLLGQELNNYYKIAVPSLPDAYLWVSTQYTKPIALEAPAVINPVIDPLGTVAPDPVQAEASEATDANSPVSAVEPAPEPAPLDRYYELKSQVDAERVKALNEQDYSAIKTGLQELIDNKDAGKASRYAQVILEQVKGIELALEVDQVLKEQNEQLKQNTEKIQKARDERLQEIQNLGRFAAVGKLENLIAFGSGNYKIVDDSGLAICYAVPSKAAAKDLSSLIGKKVGLVGAIEPNSQTSGALVRFDEVVNLEE